MDEYKRLSVERETDLYMSKICDTMDYRKIGRHATMCSELDHRLSTSVIIHVLRQVVNDTLNREISIQGILSTFLGLSIVMMISTLQSRYIKFTDPVGLPTRNSRKTIKFD